MQLPYSKIARLLASANEQPSPRIGLNYWAGDSPSSFLRVDVAASPVFRSARLLDWTPALTETDDRSVSFFLTFVQRADSLGWHIRYAGHLFSESTIAGVSQKLHDVLETVARNPQMPLP